MIQRDDMTKLGQRATIRPGKMADLLHFATPAGLAIPFRREVKQSVFNHYRPVALGSADVLDIVVERFINNNMRVNLNDCRVFDEVKLRTPDWVFTRRVRS